MSQGGIVWITGIPASGKTTLAGLLAQKIRIRGGKAEVLDGDEMRTTISSGLGWDREGRRENVRRIAFLARMLARNDVWAIVAAVSPYVEDRQAARSSSEKEGLYFQEIHTRCALSVARLRDHKKIYQSASGVTGKDSPYQPSEKAFVVDTAVEPADEIVERVFNVILWRLEDNPPVICIGRGHGGTRLVSKMMQDFGIYIGQPEQVNGCEDSTEWVRLVYRMVMECGPAVKFPDGRPYKDEIRNAARIILKSGNVSPGTPWGWKLPETTLVMPAFAEAFPTAKFIHCIRHPISSSIRSTHLTSDPKSHVGSSTVNGAYVYCGVPESRIQEDPEWLRSAYTWRHQVERAMEYGKSLGKSRYIEIRYEDICANVDWAYGTLERFLGLRRVRRRSSLDINLDRMNRWNPQDERAAKIWELCGRVATSAGYQFLDGADMSLAGGA